MRQHFLRQDDAPITLRVVEGTQVALGEKSLNRAFKTWALPVANHGRGQYKRVMNSV